MTEIEFMQKIGNNIARELRECGITQQEPADEIGVNKSTISRYIHGEMIPTIKHLFNITLVLNCNIADLVNPDETID